MEKTLGKEYPLQRRKQYLKDNADCVVEKGYMKPFTPDDIRNKKDELAETSITIAEISAEKKLSMQVFKNRLEPFSKQKELLLNEIKLKAKFVTEEVYKIIDPSEKVVGFYNSEGDLIEERPANLEELQATIFQANRKTGTNN